MKLLKQWASWVENAGWKLRQQLAKPARYYGGRGTIHSTEFLHVETYKGQVVAVWFRCQMLPYYQVEVEEERANSMKSTEPIITRIKLVGVEVIDS